MTDAEITPTVDNQSPTGVYIPTDIEDCVRELNKILSPNYQKEIKSSGEEDLWKLHFSLGMWIRNNWGLWIEDSLVV